MARATVAVSVTDMEPFLELMEGVRQMRAYEHGGGPGWWAGWGKVRAALTALDGDTTPAPPSAADPHPADQLEHARYQARVAEQALTDLHRLVEDRLDPDPSPWDDYHTGPAAKTLAAHLWRAHTTAPAPAAPAGAEDR